MCWMCRSQWPRGLRRGSAAARLLGLWVRIPPGAWKFVSCECCVWSGGGLCVGLITRPEESCRLWCVLSVVMNPRQWVDSGPLGLLRHEKKKSVLEVVYRVRDLGSVVRTSELDRPSFLRLFVARQIIWSRRELWIGIFWCLVLVFHLRWTRIHSLRVP